jgi:transcriptional pleiotropic regulator of transition state genes
MEFFIEGNRIILKPHEPGCVFCGEADKVVEFKGHNVCRQCVAAMPQRSAPAGM